MGGINWGGGGWGEVESCGVGPRGEERVWGGSRWDGGRMEGGGGTGG